MSPDWGQVWRLKATRVQAHVTAGIIGLPISLSSQGSLSLQSNEGKWDPFTVKGRHHFPIMQKLKNFHFILVHQTARGRCIHVNFGSCDHWELSRKKKWTPRSWSQWLLSEQRTITLPDYWHDNRAWIFCLHKTLISCVKMCFPQCSALLSRPTINNNRFWLQKYKTFYTKPKVEKTVIKHLLLTK